ncbi:hypothetical protein [Bifidobacterium bohemicum]|uniref:hypothetical protein n=1 Tax=Bifidobacterium bohemicum TaxID=638617 RepID=UPI001177CBD3
MRGVAIITNEKSASQASPSNPGISFVASKMYGILTVDFFAYMRQAGASFRKPQKGFERLPHLMGF